MCVAFLAPETESSGRERTARGLRRARHQRTQVSRTQSFDRHGAGGTGG